MDIETSEIGGTYMVPLQIDYVKIILDKAPKMREAAHAYMPRHLDCSDSIRSSFPNTRFVNIPG